MSKLQEFMDAMSLPDGEPFPGETIRADGWVYRDLPKMTPDALAMLIGIVGEAEIRWLSKARYASGAVRGQIFISPQGMKNLCAHTAANM